MLSVLLRIKDIHATQEQRWNRKMMFLGVSVGKLSDVGRWTSDVRHIMNICMSQIKDVPRSLLVKTLTLTLTLS